MRLSLLKDNIKKWHFDILFNNIMSKVQLRHYPAHPPPLGFIAISHHPRVKEVLSGYGTQSGAALISFLPQVIQSARGGGFSAGPALSLFLSGLMAPHRSVQSPKTVVL